MSQPPVRVIETRILVDSVRASEHTKGEAAFIRGEFAKCLDGAMKMQTGKAGTYQLIVSYKEHEDVQT